MSISFTLAHFSDPHLGPLPPTGWRSLANKRLSGFLSWTRNRVKIHRSDILAMLTDDLAHQPVDHVAITGDLVNISLPGEFSAAAAWLRTIGAPDRVTVIPGNHDAYVNIAWSQSLALWAEYMRGARAPIGPETLPDSMTDFPFIRRLGPIALVGTSTALPMPVFVAAGRLGPAQCDRLRAQLIQLGEEGVFRVVLIHHPPFGGGAYRRKALLDAARFQAVLAEAGAELVLHGHTHVSGLTRARTPAGTIPIIGVPSASAIAAGHKDPARYHIYRIEKRADSWSLEVEIRGLNAAADGFERQGSMALTIPLLSSVSRTTPPGTATAAVA